ncbi:hypothetical protein BST61_g10048 [Cercospora zeina]
METSDTYGRGWYGVVIVPKKQKGESFHDKAKRKAQKIIVQMRPDLAIGDFGKPARERNFKVALVRDDGGNIVVPKKRKNETRGELAARKAAEMAVRMQMAKISSAREHAAHNSHQHHGAVDLVNDETGESMVPKKRKGETLEERAARKAANSARMSATSKLTEAEQLHKSWWQNLTEEEREARRELQRGNYNELRLQGKERAGEWDSEAFVSKRHGALPALQFGAERSLRPKTMAVEEKCNDCGDTNERHWYWGRTLRNTWVRVCHLCWGTRYKMRWRKSRPESRSYIGSKGEQYSSNEQRRQASISGPEMARTDTVLPPGDRVDLLIAKKRK